jgi:hypothetical protein
MDSTYQSLKETNTLSEGSVWVVPSVLAVDVTDYTEYYTICGIVMLIVIMLLLWYFVRSTSNNIPNNYQIKKNKRSPLNVLTPQCLSKNESELIPKYQNTPKYQNAQDKPTNQFTDKNYKFGPLQKGVYGGVVVYFNEISDNKYTSEWRTPNGGLYVLNSRTLWKDANTPNEAKYWALTANQSLINNR